MFLTGHLQNFIIIIIIVIVVVFVVYDTVAVTNCCGKQSKPLTL